MEAQAFRVARPSDDLDAVVHFYRDGVGFEVIASFSDHDGFDGKVLGMKGQAYHLEFTRNTNHPAGRAPTKDNLLIFYIPEKSAWNAAILRMQEAGYNNVESFNPYWDRMGPCCIELRGFSILPDHATLAA